MTEAGRRVGPAELARMRAAGQPIAALTAYDAPMAGLVDAAGADMIIVGDSVALFALGRTTTLGVTLDEMIHHARAVRAADTRAMVIADLPYMSYEPGARDGVLAAGRLVKEAGADGVKMPLHRGYAATLHAIAEAGVPVLAHLVPSALAGTEVDNFAPLGRDEAEAAEVRRAARAFEEAGAFAILLETVDAAVAATVARERDVPVLGFGSGPHCDGQVSSSVHVLGLAPGPMPSFMRTYVDGAETLRAGLSAFCRDVRDGSFPSPAEILGGAG